MTSEDDFDAAWDRLADSESEAQPSAEDQAAAAGIDVGPPIRVTVVIRAETVPVAPWAQGWRIAAAGPHDGLLSMLFEQDTDDSPVAQLAAVTGLLSTIKSAQLDLVWWAIQTRGPFPGEEPTATTDLDQELKDLLADSGEDS
jgi:hypothetical protein